ncbi:MAG: S-layer protein [Candidatus Altarchaeaceae archaeon]
MRKYKKICAAIGGAAIVSAALMGIASASDTGLTEIDKSFVYDANYNPIVQVAVGENAQAKDVVGAGNIAAAIGNLAYTECAAAGAAGEVKLAVKSWQVTGKYEQDKPGVRVGKVDLEGTKLRDDFYDANKKQPFAEGNETWNNNGIIVYTHGMLKNYNIGCEKDTKVAEFPKKGEYCNEICYLCYNRGQEEIKHPSHNMEERFIVDGKLIKYFEDGLGCDSKPESLKMHVDCGALRYEVDLGGIPTSSIKDNDGNLIDSAYRGKILFMGSDEYFVEDLARNYIVMAKGEKLKISDVGYTEPTLPELAGYKIKLKNIIQAGGKNAGIVVEIVKPDGTSITGQATRVANLRLPKDANGHQLELQAMNAMGSPGQPGMDADVIVYDLSTQLRLESGKKINDLWRVNIEAKTCDKVGIPDYTGNADKKYCLTKLTLTQEDARTLNVGDSINFPTGSVGDSVKFTFEGYKDTDFKDIVCSGGDDQIKITTNDNYKVLLSFTNSDKKKFENVRLDEGPYNEGDLFLIGNTVYKFKGTEDVKNSNGSIDESKIKILLTDMTGANDIEAIFEKDNNGFPGFVYKTFDGKAKSDPACPTCTTMKLDNPFGINGVTGYFKGGKLWTDRNNDRNISLNDIYLTDFETDTCGASLTVVRENGIDINNDGNTDDEILVFKGCGGDETYIDLYDRNHTNDESRDFKTSVKIKGEEITNVVCNNSQCCYNITQVDFVGQLKCKEDTVLYSARGADKFTATYGDKNQLKSVTICHPKKEAYITYFLGKEKKESEINATITQDDVGKLKRAACCEFIVKTFGLTGGAGCNMKVNAIGNIVVTDTAADTSKNLIVVGGPSVNTLATDVTKDEIYNDPDKYVIKKVGNKLIVAGWEADDTLAATNKVVEWLKNNVHKAA